jgi:quercetin dioxygenase-like cupin family protein
MKTVAIAFLTLALASVIRVAVAEPPKPEATVREILQQSLPNIPGTDVVVLTVDYPPGGTTPPHEHPGNTYAYVLKGSVVSQLGDEPPHTYSEGQMWSETPHQHHLVSRNASATESARLLVFFLIPKGAKLTKMLLSKP